MGSIANLYNSEPRQSECSVIAMKLSSLMNALATEIALALDELEAEPILTQHTQGLLYCETRALVACGKGNEILRHSSNTRVSQCLQRVVSLLCVRERKQVVDLFARTA